MAHRWRCSAFARLLLQLNVEKPCRPTEVATDAPAEPVPRAASANQPSVLASLPQGQPSEGRHV